jgi:geranylgeranyl diphosphate synthase type II
VKIPVSYQNLIKKEIEDFCDELNPSPEELYEPMRYMMQLEGKRLRPILLLLSCKTFGGTLKPVMPAALAVEIFHSFTLMHDDITDNAPLRRSKPSVHIKWNTNIALLSGDAMMIKAYEYLSKTPRPYLHSILQVFNDTALKVCEGQQMDMNFETEEHVSINDYLEMIRLKTAALFAASLQMGAILGGASSKDATKMKLFGENIGMLFQLQDDILDVFGKPEKVGKQTGGDIIQNKKTFLLLNALELAKGNMLKELQSLLMNKTIKPKEKVERVTAIYTKVGVLQHARKQMEAYYKAAQKAISPIKSPETKILLGLVTDMMSREI